MEFDETYQVRSVFWVDNKLRLTYMYGDVVVFDVTYNTNNFNISFAPFMGVILLGLSRIGHRRCW